MLYYLLYPLNEMFGLFNIFQYISFRAAGAAITSLIISFLIGPKIIRTLKFHQIGETIRKDGPHTHQKKEGTPTMGGIIILLSIILPTLLWGKFLNQNLLLILFATAWMGIIGFVDDYLKVVKKYDRGLIAKYKMVGQISLGIFFGFFLIQYPQNPSIITQTSIPFIANGMIDLSLFYFPFIILVITATSNAVNLTDGLDGLAAGLVAIATGVFSIIAYISGRFDFSNYLRIQYLADSGELFIFCLSMIGACIGFLWYNAKPAKIFMGDTGSLAIGSALGALAILLKKEILLIIIGGVFVIETLSVFLQVFYFKYTKFKTGEGKRLFNMAPLHHHFELKGIDENHIVIRFWIIGVLFALLSLTTFKIQ